MNMLTQKIREWVIQFVENIHTLTSLTIGGVIIVISIAMASFISISLLAAVVAAAGAILGTLFAYPALVKVLVVDNPKINTQETVKALNALHSEKEMLMVEVERLKAQRLRVESFTPTAELCVLSVDTKITDFKTVYFDESGKEVDKSIPHVAKYFGCIEKEFKAKFGPDLSKLQIMEVDGDKLAVFGVIGEFRGFSNLQKKWHLRDVLEKRFVPAKLGDKFVVLDGDQRALSLSEQQEQLVLERINQGVEFAHLQAGIGRVARNVIEVLLSPLGKQVEFYDGKGPDGSAPMLAYLEGYRQRLANKLKDAQEKLQITDSSLRQITNG